MKFLKRLFCKCRQKEFVGYVPAVIGVGYIGATHAMFRCTNCGRLWKMNVDQGKIVLRGGAELFRVYKN
jgi:hypothetical protein